MTRTVYDSAVTQVGGQVEQLLGHRLLILFGAGAPAELHDISVLHVASLAEDGPRAGDTLHIGDASFEVLAVGAVVRDNLLNLGHLDIKADGRTEPALQGDVCIPVTDLPLPATGQVFRITRPTPDSRGHRARGGRGEGSDQVGAGGR